jgi:hypothetical protein
MPLSDATVRSAKPATAPRKLSDSGGLFLLVTPKPVGSKLWRLAYRFGGEATFAIRCPNTGAPGKLATLHGPQVLLPFQFFDHPGIVDPCLKDSGAAGPTMTNALYYGDNLAVLKDSIKDESVDLIYLDPPFNCAALRTGLVDPFQGCRPLPRSPRRSQCDCLPALLRFIKAV